jgi:TPP-dependent pyruvate/acetoin dehydrogenase alpha subunit
MPGGQSDGFFYERFGFALLFNYIFIVYILHQQWSASWSAGALHARPCAAASTLTSETDKGGHDA